MRDVVVVGAGVAGSSIAAVLGTLGWNVQLLDRRTLPHHKVCGEFLSPESQASLHAMGLYEIVSSLQPQLIQHARLVSPQGTTLDLNLPGTGLGVSRYALDLALAEAAVRTGVQFDPGVTVDDVSLTDAGYDVALRTPRGRNVVATRTVIMACGRAPLKRLRPIERPTRSSTNSYVGVKCHYVDVAVSPTVELFCFDGGYAGISPINGEQVNYCLLTTRAAFARAGGSDRAMLEAAAHWNPMLGRRLAGGRMQPDSVVSVAAVNTRQRGVPWDRMPRIGDAAAMIPPLCGDGMSMALRSAELCVPAVDAYLRGQISRTTWESQYRSQWHTEFDGRMRTSRLLEGCLTRPWLADVCLRLGTYIPALATLLLQATRGKARSFDQVSTLVAPIKAS